MARLAVRIVLAALLIGALAGLVVHHGATADENWPHPTGDQLQDDYDQYVGERLLLFGEVQSVDSAADTLVIHVTTDENEIAAELEIHDTAVAVEPGGLVQVYGLLEADRTMTPEETVVVNRDAGAVQYKLLTSVAGGLLAVSYFLVHWRPNLRTGAFEPRASADSSPRSNSDAHPDATSRAAGIDRTAETDDTTEARRRG